MTRQTVREMFDVKSVVRGDIPAGARTEAEAMVRTLAGYAHNPVLHARIWLTRSGDPARERPVVAQVNLDVNGRLVRAQVAGHTAHEAIDLLRDRARHRLERLARRWEVCGAPRGSVGSTQRAVARG